MATSVQPQSQTELKCYLEECLHIYCPAASNQEIANAVNVAMGNSGYMLDHTYDQRGQQSREQLMLDNNQLSVMCASIASVRDAAIAATQGIADASLRMAAIACACASYGATCALAEQINQQKATCN